MKFYNRWIVFVLFVFGSTFVFSQEICDNGIDDDGDGLVDCLDPDCIDDADACPAFAFPGSCLPIGYIPDINGTGAGFKEGGSTDDVLIPLPASTNRVSLIIQGVYQQAPVDAETGIDDLNHAQERIVWGRVELDLDNGESSGWVEYAVNNHESKRFSWVDQPTGPAGTETYTRVGHDFAELLDFEFVFDYTADDLVIGCSEADIDISYYAVFYGNFDSQSLTRIPGEDPSQYPVYFDAGPDPENLTATIDLLTGDDKPDYIQIRALGINQNRYGNSGVLVEDTREEAMSIKYIIIDLNTLTASGNMTVNNGNIPDMNTSFTFMDYDVTSGDLVTDGGTILGDADGNITLPDQIAICDMIVEVVGDQLIITRSDEHGGDFNEIYYIEFLKYSDQPYSSSFYLTQNAYSGPSDIGFDFGAPDDGVSVDGFVDFEIPQGSKRGYLEIRANGLWSPFSLASFEGPAPSNTTRTNGNQMYAFTEVNFDLEETTGYFVTITTSTQQQLYAWQEVPIDPTVDITTLDIYGQLPNSDERLNFEIIEPNIFRVHLENDKLAYERILNMTFLGSKVNLVYSTFEYNEELTTGCDSVYFDMEICNSGGTDLTIPVPVSFYTADPTIDPTAVYLQTELYDLDIDQGQCETFSFGIDISSLGGALSGDITIVLNDDGSFAGIPGDVIPDTFDPQDLGEQDSPVLECEYDFNIITSDYDITLPPLPTVTFNEDLFIICPSDEATIIATVEDAIGEVTYEWSPEFGDTEELTVSPSVTTWYYLVVEDECQSIIDSVKVEIGTVNISSLDVVDAETCPGIEGGLLGSLTILPDLSDYIYTLSGGGDVFGPTGDNLFTDLTGGVFYLLNITDAEGCFLDTSVFIGLGDNEVTANLVLGSLTDVSCFGANDGGIIVENFAGGVLPPFDVIWSDIDGTFDTDDGLPSGGSAAIDNLYGGSWTVTVLDQEGCAWSDTFNIYEPDELTIDMLFNNPSCFGFSDGSITANTSGGNPGKIYEIRNEAGDLLNVDNSNTANTLPEGTYTINVTDENGCSVDAVVDLVHPGEMDADLIFINPLCNGFETGEVFVDLVYNATGNYDSLSFFWAPNPDGIEGIGADTISNLPAGEYVLTINDQNGCSNSFAFEITEPDPMFFAEFGTEPAYCRVFDYQSGNGVLFGAAAGGVPDYTYQWINLDEETFTENSTWGGQNPGNYSLTAIDANGCIHTQEVTLDSLNPIADFSVLSDQLNADCKGTAPVEVVIVNESENFIDPNDPFAEEVFFFTFGFDPPNWRLINDFGEQFDTTFTVGGIYEVCLMAQNGNGCVDTLCKPIEVFDQLEFGVVNIFSPNNDGENDVFTFEYRAQAVAEFECVIMNRWGVTVAEINDITVGWNGDDINGDPCTNGVYFYTYKGVADNGELFGGQGTVQIVGKP